MTFLGLTALGGHEIRINVDAISSYCHQDHFHGHRRPHTLIDLNGVRYPVAVLETMGQIDEMLERSGAMFWRYARQS